MAVTVSSFMNYFPEFKREGDSDHEARIQQCITNAELRTPADTWGELRDQGILYLAAHLLALSPSGINAKLASVAGNSVYKVQRRALAVTVAYGRTAGFDSTEYPSDSA